MQGCAHASDGLMQGFLYAGMQPISVLAPYLPIPLHRKRDVARKKIGELFADIVKKRRASGVKENDVLQVCPALSLRYDNNKKQIACAEKCLIHLLYTALKCSFLYIEHTRKISGLFILF